VTNDPSSAQPGDLVEKLGDKLYSGVLTLEQARTALRVSKYTLAKMIKNGELKVIKIGPKYYIGEGTLNAYIDNAQGNATNGTTPS